MTRLKATVLLVLVAVPALLLGLGRRELWNPVEPRYAGVTAEMLNEGRWLVPSYNGQDYDQKPAFYFWLTAASISGADGQESRLFRLRLPSALGGLLLALATMLIGRRLFDLETGLLGGAMLLSCWLIFWSGRFCHLDTLSAASLAFLIHAMLSRAQGGSSAFLVQAVIALTAGLLLKGPGVILFALLAFLLLSLAPSGRGLLRRSGIFLALPIGIALAACWFIPAWLSAGDVWARGLLIDAGVFHLVDPTNAAKHGPFYYSVVLFTVAAPWSLLLPAALLGRYRAWRSGACDRREGFGNALLIAWILAILIVLHLGTTYRSRYLMPLLPALMLLMARSLRRELAPLGARDMKAAVLMARTGLGLGLLLMLMLGLLIIFAGPVGAQIGAGLAARALGEFGRSAGLAPLLGALIVSLSLFGGHRLIKDRVTLTGALIALVAACVLSFATWGLEGAPALDRVQGDAALFATVGDQLDGRKLVTVENYGLQESTAGFYGFALGARLVIVKPDRGSLEALRTGEAVLLLLRQRDLAEFDPDSKARFLAGWTPINEQPLGRHAVWIFSNGAGR